MPPKVPAKLTRSDRDRSVSGSPGAPPNQIDRDIAKRLLRVRISRQLSQQDVAERAGFPVPLYADLEAAKIRIDATRLSRLAMALDLPISWFFGSSHVDELVTWDSSLASKRIGDQRHRRERDIEGLRARLENIRSNGSDKGSNK